MTQIASKDDLKNHIEELIRQHRLFQKAKDDLALPQDWQNANQALSQHLYYSKAGKEFEAQINKIMLFWTKIYSPNLSLQIVSEFGKIVLNALVGDATYLKLKKKWEEVYNEMSQSKKLTEIISLTDDDHDLIGTMTVIAFAGMVEDYLKKVRDQIHSIHQMREATENHSHFSRRFKYASLTNKVNVLLESMNLKDFVHQEISNQKGNAIITEFETFRELRNEIAHQGATVKFLSLKPEIVSLSGIVGQLIRTNIKFEQKTTIAKQQAVINLLTRYEPIISYLYVLYYKIFPLLSVLDYSFTKHCRERLDI